MKKTISVILSFIMIITTFLTTYAASFSDVGDDFSWAAEAIESFCAEKIIEGRGDGTFAPNEDVTRAEFAKMLVLTFELSESGEISYSDVIAGTWEHAYVSAADRYTISASVLDSAYSDDEYAPNKEVSRQEIAAAIVNAIGEERTADSGYLKGNFADSDSVNPAVYEKVNLAAELGLIRGYEDNTLRPKENVTRAEAVVLLDRAREYIKTSNTPTTSPSPAPTQTPTPSPSQKPTAEPVPTPNAVNDLVSVVDILLTSIDGEMFYSLYYAFGGVKFDEPLIVFEDATVGGLKTKVSDISCGDLILYDFHMSGKVNAIRVIFSPEESMPTEEKNLDKIIAVSQKMSWGLYNSGSRTQMCYGRIERTDKMDNGIVLRLKYQEKTEQAVLVPHEGARISVYKPYAYSNEKRFEAIEARDIFGSYDIDMDYVFVKMQRDIATDVIIIDYEK